MLEAPLDTVFGEYHCPKCEVVLEFIETEDDGTQWGWCERCQEEYELEGSNED